MALLSLEQMPYASPCVLEQAVFENHSQDTRYTGPLETAPTVNATYGVALFGADAVCLHHKLIAAVLPDVKGIQRVCHFPVLPTLSASMGSKQWLGNQEAFSGDYHIIGPDYIVRRLTPTECARLQGFPDWWCDGLGTENPTEEDTPLPCGPFLSSRPIMEPCTATTAMPPWLQDGLPPLASSVRDVSVS